MKFLHTKKGKIVMNFIYGMGASVVIIGAWAKILHLSFANVMITVGLLTEAFIFAISAFDPPAEELDWTLVYPELAGMPADENRRSSRHGGSLTQEIDKLLEEAKVGPELFESLGNSINRLSENASKLADITDASVATEQYVSSVSLASEKVHELSETYVKAAQSLTTISESQASGQSFAEELQRVSKNLSALNNVYELQLQGSQEYLEATSRVYANIAQLLTNLSESVDDTQRFKEEIAKLGQNLSALNTVYGNMLAAMNIRPAYANA
jgi:gliding motility-associated protein GldL